MKNYYRIMLGRASAYAEEAHNGNYIGGGWLHDADLSGKLPENWRDFNKSMIPLYLEKNPERTKMSAALACGALWTIAKGIQINDIVLCPNGERAYYVGEVTASYTYHPESKNFVHQRTVRWFPETILRDEMSQALRNSTGSINTVCDISKYADEIEKLLSGNHLQVIVSTDETVEDPSIFALEKHLEDFLVHKWKSTERGKKDNIYEEEGERIGQQYPSDTGPIDILAVSKDKKELLVVELKKGRIGDVVVGQVQRYMVYVKDELAEEDQKVRGVIIAFEDDIKIRRALSVTQNIDFYTYKVNFKLEKK